MFDIEWKYLDKFPFKIRATKEGTFFDDEEFTHKSWEDILYVRVETHPVETALKLLEEQGYEVTLKIKKEN